MYSKYSFQEHLLKMVMVHMGMDMAVFSDFHLKSDGNMGADLGICADFDILVDHCIRADGDIFSELGRGMDDRCGMDACEAGRRGGEEKFDNLLESTGGVFGDKEIFPFGQGDLGSDANDACF